MADYSIPYAASERYRNPYIGTLLELMQQQSQAQAAATERLAALAGQRWQSLGQTGATIAQAIAEAPERRRRAELQQMHDDELRRTYGARQAVAKMPRTADPAERQQYVGGLTADQARAVEAAYRDEDAVTQQRADAAENRLGAQALAAIGQPGAFSGVLDQMRQSGWMTNPQYANLLAAAGDSGDPAGAEREILTGIYAATPAGRTAISEALGKRAATDIAAAPDRRKAQQVTQLLRPDMPAAEQLQVFRSVWGPQGDAKFKEYADALSAAAPKLTTFGENQGVIQTDPVTGIPTVLREPTPKATGDVPLDRTYLQASVEAFRSQQGRDPSPQELQGLVLAARKTLGAADDNPVLQQIRQLQVTQLQRNQQAMTPAQAAMAGRLADDYTQQSKDYLTRLQARDAIRTAATNPSAAGDLALIFAFMRMLDPGSTVREGEFANAQNAAGVPDTIRNAYNRAMTGERLNPAQRADFRAQAESQFASAQRRQRGLMNVFTGRAKRAGLNPEDVVIDYDTVFAPATPAGVSDDQMERILRGKP